MNSGEKYYYADDLLSEMIEKNYRILLIMNRFGIGLGHGEETIGEVCLSHGVDTETFLAVVNAAMATDRPDGEENRDTGKVKAQELIAFLIDSHDYYLEQALPTIRRELAEVWEGPGDDIFRVVIRCFDDFALTVAKHAEEEEKGIFKYLDALTKGKKTEATMTDVAKEHREAQRRLNEVKLILIKYFPTAESGRMHDVMARLASCQWDMDAHARIEERVMESMVRQLEKKQNVTQPLYATI